MGDMFHVNQHTKSHYDVLCSCMCRTLLQFLPFNLCPVLSTIFHFIMSSFINPFHFISSFINHLTDSKWNKNLKQINNCQSSISIACIFFSKGNQPDFTVYIYILAKAFGLLKSTEQIIIQKLMPPYESILSRWNSQHEVSPAVYRNTTTSTFHHYSSHYCRAWHMTPSSCPY